MITTVTTITTITTIAAIGITAALSIACVATLILFLTTKELASARRSDTYTRIARFVNIGILPLVLVFAVIVAVKIIEVLT